MEILNFIQNLYYLEVFVVMGFLAGLGIISGYVSNGKGIYFREKKTKGRSEVNVGIIRNF